MRFVVLLLATVGLAACQKPAAGPAETPASAAASSVTAPVVAADGPPPLSGGYYLNRATICGDAGCDHVPGKWFALKPVPLYAQPGSTAVVAQLPARECVSATEEASQVAPLRGTVQASGGGLATGDIVYLIDSDGSTSTIWARGAVKSVDVGYEGEPIGAGAPQITWDVPAADALPSVRWVHLKRLKGGDGWARDYDDLQGMGEADGCDHGMPPETKDQPTTDQDAE